MKREKLCNQCSDSVQAVIDQQDGDCICCERELSPLEHVVVDRCSGDIIAVLCQNCSAAIKQHRLVANKQYLLEYTEDHNFKKVDGSNPYKPY